MIRNRDITFSFRISLSSSFIIRLNLSAIYYYFLTLRRRRSLYILANIINSLESLAYLDFPDKTFIRLKSYYLLTTLNIILDLSLSFFIIFYI